MTTATSASPWRALRPGLRASLPQRRLRRCHPAHQPAATGGRQDQRRHATQLRGSRHRSRPKSTPTPPPSLVTARADEKRRSSSTTRAWRRGKRRRAPRMRHEEMEKKEALMMIRQSASLDPTFAEPLIMLSRLAMKSQNWAEASRYSEDLIRIDPNDVDAVRTLYFSMVIMRHHIRIGEAATTTRQGRPRHHRLHRRACPGLFPQRDLPHGERPCTRR